MAESKSQKKANRKWLANNREHANYLRYRTTAKLFIKKHATKQDLEELKTLIQQRENELENT